MGENEGNLFSEPWFVRNLCLQKAFSIVLRNILKHSVWSSPKLKAELMEFVIKIQIEAQF